MFKQILKRNAFLGLITMLSLTATSTSFAGYGGGKILTIIADQGAIQIRTETHNAPPACATIQDGLAEWSISTTTHEGRAKYALILMAYAQGKPVNIHGANQCSVWPDRESIQFINVF